MAGAGGEGTREGVNAEKIVSRRMRTCDVHRWEKDTRQELKESGNARDTSE